MIFFIASEHFCRFCHRLLLLIMGRQQQQQQILMKFLRWLASYHQLWLDPIVFNIMIEPSCLHSCIIDPSIKMAKRKNQWRGISVLSMAANKNKEFLFFGFYKFFVFCKIFRSKKQKIEIWSNYCPFFNFLEYLQKNIEILFLKIYFYGVFMRNLQKIVHNLEYFLKE